MPFVSSGVSNRCEHRSMAPLNAVTETKQEEEEENNNNNANDNKKKKTIR